MLPETTPAYQFEVLDAQVKRVFRIETFQNGTPKQGFIMRYTGRVISEDAAEAYDRLANGLKPYNITPLFRMDKDKHVVILVPGIPEPKKSNPVVNLVLFIATLISVILVGSFFSVREPLPADPLAAVIVVIRAGLPFAASMLAILGAHEFGHYLAGRSHGVHVTLPYFIPMPFSPFGTMGAFINMKEHPKNRRQLLDIGIAGPLSGLVVAIPILLLGLSLSPLDTIPQVMPPGSMMEGNSLLYLLAKYVVFGELLPAPVTYGDVHPLLYWVRYIFTGAPFPYGGLDVQLHPVAFAGWAGILITGLNLIPAGQLDGGHMLYVLFGRQTAQRVLPFILVALVGLGFVWSGWWLWAMIIFLLGRAYAEPLDQITPLDSRRRGMAILALILFVLTFTPVPLLVL
ncbi:MAG: site-2 protease family protein [Anaerolineaceae bacterium]|jgi:membrane-associated protease RseP (regulator of RpoE activity)